MPRKILILVTGLVLLLAIVFTGGAFAQESHECHWESGMAFGQHHAEMARAGMLGADENPGTHHRGYSICAR
jgi:hypothetical protein